MRLVVDASVALQWVLQEPQSLKARALRDEFRQGLHDLVAPDSFFGEVAHALTRAERKKIFPVGEAKVQMVDLLSTAPRLAPFLGFVWRAIEISSSSRIGLFDRPYVALAEQENCDLVTADTRLVNSLQGYPIISLADV